MGLGYCSRSWGRWDSGICEMREYGEARPSSWSFFFSFFLFVIMCDLF